MTIIECNDEALEVRESPSEVLRRLENSTLHPRDPIAASDPAAAEMGSFEVTAIDGTLVIVQVESVLSVREG